MTCKWVWTKTHTKKIITTNKHNNYNDEVNPTSMLFAIAVVVQLNENCSHRYFFTRSLSLSLLFFLYVFLWSLSIDEKKPYPLRSIPASEPCVRVCIYVLPCHESSALWNVIEKNDYKWHVHADSQSKIKIKGRIMRKNRTNIYTQKKTSTIN